MKNLLKVFGIIAFIAVIGFTMTACDEKDGVESVTITGIPSEYNGKFAMMLVDKGSKTHGWAMGTITGTSSTFNLLDWDDDEPTTISEDNYTVALLIANNVNDVSAKTYLFEGIIMSRSFSGTTVSIGFGEFINAAGTPDQFKATVTGIPSEHNDKYASVYVYNVGSARPEGGFYIGSAAGSSNRILISNGTVTAPLFVNTGLITNNPLTTLAPGTYHASLFMYTAASGAGNNFYQSERLEITVTAEKTISIAFSSLTALP